MGKQLLILAFGLTLLSCQKMPVIDSNEITFDFILPESTKVTSTDFETGDMVGIYATAYESVQPQLEISGNWINNELLTYNGQKWIPQRKVTWAEGKKMDIYAYYPYSNDISSIDEQNFSVALDQSTEKTAESLGGYESSDLLWANTTGISKDSETPSPVKLKFSHVCSKVVVKLVKGNGFQGSFPADAKMLIHNTVPDGVLNYTDGSISKNIYGTSSVITCRRVENCDTESPEYEAIVIPQRVDTRRPFLEYLTDKVSYLAEDTFNFKPGYCYTYTMTISSSPEQLVISIGGTIEGWN